MFKFLFSALFAFCLALPSHAEGVWSSDGDDGNTGLWSSGGKDPDAPAPDPDEAVAIAQDALLSVFYHELGHALIEILQPPVLGLEEDAADILSALMINELWDEESSEVKLRAAAGLWAASAAEWAAAGESPAYYGVHSPDERRYYTYVCLWYGASPETREGVAIDLGLPEERAVSCPSEFELANDSWGPYLDDVYAAGAGKTLVWTGPDPDSDPFAAILKEEVDYLNSILSLPTELTVTYEPCGMPNAFFDPSVTGITMCTEMAEWALDVASR